MGVLRLVRVQAHRELRLGSAAKGLPTASFQNFSVSCGINMHIGAGPLPHQHGHAEVVARSADFVCTSFLIAISEYSAICARDCGEYARSAFPAWRPRPSGPGGARNLSVLPPRVQLGIRGSEKGNSNYPRRAAAGPSPIL